MKTRSKSILLVLCAVLLVAASVLGTLAYLTASDTVTNTFTLGQVAITLDEALVDDDGQEIVGDGAQRVDGNEYKLVPGHEYDKDPTIHVGAASEDSWLFVKVENGISPIEAKGDTTIAAQMDKNGWKLVNGTSNVYYYANIVKADADVPVFENFTIDEDVDGDTLAQYADAKVVVVAYAVQADAFETAADAWAGANFAD